MKKVLLIGAVALALVIAVAVVFLLKGRFAGDSKKVLQTEPAKQTAPASETANNEQALSEESKVSETLRSKRPGSARSGSPAGSSGLTVQAQSGKADVLTPEDKKQPAAMVHAEDNMTDASQSLTIPAQKIKAACNVIEENVKKGANIRKLVRTSIQMGFNACSIIRCSIEGNGNLEEIISGAIEAGTGPDVVSRCALSAGAKAGDIALILSGLSAAGVCFLMPEKPEMLVPPDIPVISASKFK